MSNVGSDSELLDAGALATADLAFMHEQRRHNSTTATAVAAAIIAYDWALDEREAMEGERWVYPSLNEWIAHRDTLGDLR